MNGQVPFSLPLSINLLTPTVYKYIPTLRSRDIALVDFAMFMGLGVRVCIAFLFSHPNVVTPRYCHLLKAGTLHSFDHSNLIFYTTCTNSVETLRKYLAFSVE